MFIYLHGNHTYMASRTTVAINDSLRKRIKKLSALLDVSQGEIIEKAIEEYEHVVFSKIKQTTRNDKNATKNPPNDVKDVLEAATRDVWASDPETKAIQQKLLSTPGTIDDFILDSWDSGLDT